MNSETSWQLEGQLYTCNDNSNDSNGNWKYQTLFLYLEWTEGSRVLEWLTYSYISLTSFLSFFFTSSLYDIMAVLPWQAFCSCSRCCCIKAYCDKQYGIPVEPRKRDENRMRIKWLMLTLPCWLRLFWEKDYLFICERKISRKKGKKCHKGIAVYPPIYFSLHLVADSVNACLPYSIFPDLSWPFIICWGSLLYSFDVFFQLLPQ